MTLQGAEFFFRIVGEAAVKTLARLFAALNALHEKMKGQQKLGGKIDTRAFINNFIASSVIPLSQEELKKIGPELKRLHIPYMQYRSTKDMKANGIVEISVRNEDVDRFIRIAEQNGIALTDAEDAKIEEITQKEYQEALKDSSVKGIDFYVMPGGEVIVNEHKNPTQAPAGPSNPSESNSEELKLSDTDQKTGSVKEKYSGSTPLEFHEKQGVDKNLKNAYSRADYLKREANDEFVPLSINKDTLLIESDSKTVTVYVPGTSRERQLVIPRSDIINMNADGGQTIIANLGRDKPYQILDKNGRPEEIITGKEIKDEDHWDKVSENKLSRQKAFANKGLNGSKNTRPAPKKGGAR